MALTVEAALRALLQRVEVTVEQSGDRFPLYADPRTGRWVTTRRGSWTGGFFTGWLWLRAAITGAVEQRETAARWSRRLEPRLADDTDTRAMTFWYGAAFGERLCGDAAAGELAARAAGVVAGSYDPELAAIPVGTAFGGAAPARLGIDALAAVAGLLGWDHGQVPQVAVERARDHAEACRDRLLTPAGAVRATADGATVPAGEPERLWSRGQAWGMLGFAAAAHRLDPAFGEPAERSADWWLRATATDPVPPAILGRADSPPDSSAAAIAAAALWSLSQLPELPAARATGYRGAAWATIEALLARHLAPDGRLGGGCYDLDGGLASAHELVWGSFFLASVLAVAVGAVPVEPW